MKFRLDDGSEPAEGRFNDARTTYMGRKIKLPVFWIGGERFALSLSNAQQATGGVEVSVSILSRCLDMIEGHSDRRGIEGAALLLQEQCRKLMGWKATIKRDKTRLRPRGYYL